MRTLQLKLILLFRSVPNDDIKLRKLLNKVGLIERLTPYVAGGRGPLRSDEARKRGDRRTNVSSRDNRHASGDSCRSAQLGWVSNGDSLHPPLSVRQYGWCPSDARRTARRQRAFWVGVGPFGFLVASC
jgi:hypothetical protein